MTTAQQQQNISYGPDDLLEILPHRYPFLLIDRVISLDPTPAEGTSWVGRKAVALKNITFNEPFFQGHFPDQPIMPGVLIVEAMAQAAAVCGYRPPRGDERMVVRFASIEKAKFRKPVFPGDQLKIHVEIMKDRGSIYYFRSEAFVDDELVAEAELLAKAMYVPRSQATKQRSR
jgi:3-hydroxyacyl-[acyl-carrier-protein] dehydratase